MKKELKSQLTVLSLAAVLLASVLVGTLPSASAQSKAVSIISSSSYMDTLGWMHVVGEVKNTSTNTLRYVNIVATFYDSANKVVGTSFAYSMIDPLRPGEKSPFHIILISQEQSAKANSYKLSVTSSPGSANPANLILRLGDSYYDVLGWYHIVGEVTNKGDRTATYVEVVATLYDSNGQPRDVVFTYTQPTDIPPGGTSPFELLSLITTGQGIASISANVQSNEYSRIDDSLPKQSEATKQSQPATTPAKQTQETTEYKAKLSLSASLTEKTKTMIVSLKNPKNSDAQVYELHLEFPDSAIAKSAVAPSGWSKDVDGNAVTFSTEKKPLLANKSIKFKITLDKVVKSIDWDAYDEDGNLINSKTSKVAVRK